MGDNPLINLGELSKPATVLVERISDAVGGIFKPWQMRRVAKAEAEIEQIRAESEIQVTEIHRRAVHRWMQEEANKQSNIEAITQKALPLLDEKAEPQNVEKDWITNFFDKCRIVSDDDMQTLWSKVLAGEANRPGAFSRRTVNLLGDLEKRDAELFTALCRFVWTIANAFVPLVYDPHDTVYRSNNIHLMSLLHLESLGLVQYNANNFSRRNLQNNFPVYYYGRCVQLSLPDAPNNFLDVGKVLFSLAGSQLANICGVTPVEGFFDYVCEKWKKAGHLPEISSIRRPSPPPV
jgi:hypothetical protein